MQHSKPYGYITDRRGPLNSDCTRLLSPFDQQSGFRPAPTTRLRYPYFVHHAVAGRRALAGLCRHRKANIRCAVCRALLSSNLWREHRPRGRGSIVCVNANGVSWEHWTSEAARQGPHLLLAKLADCLLEPLPLCNEPSLTAHYPGITVKGGQSFNFRFPRR